MNGTEKEKKAGKWLTAAIVGLVFAGTVLLPTLGGVGGEGGGFFNVLFLAFFGAVIAIQVVPGVMLFGFILKGIAEVVRKGRGEALQKKD